LSYSINANSDNSAIKDKSPNKARNFTSGFFATTATTTIAAITKATYYPTKNAQN